MSEETAQPRTIWERAPDEVSSGMRVGVRGAIFRAGAEDRSAVTLTIEVPEGFHQPLPGDGRAASIVLNPDEAHGLSSWLTEAAAAALETAPPLYD